MNLLNIQIVLITISIFPYFFSIKYTYKYAILSYLYVYLILKKDIPDLKILVVYQNLKKINLY